MIQFQRLLLITCLACLCCSGLTAQQSAAQSSASQAPISQIAAAQPSTVQQPVTQPSAVQQPASQTPITQPSVAQIPSPAQPAPRFKVIAFFTSRNDKAHISFVHEANRWFPEMAKKYNFSYDSTKDWTLMNPAFLSGYQVVLFLDTRPDTPSQREAFRKYMENGGGWMGFHFSGFALTPSDFPQNWDWYHNEFLGSGSYVSNTWRPVSAVLRVEDRDHLVTRHLPQTFRSSPCEWYRWSNDLRKNKDIKILLSVDSTSFPLGTGPKPYEIWHSGYYPIVWTNKNYRMVYMNIGHNDIDYENKTDKELSFTFGNPVQDRMILDALLWLGSGKKD